MNEKPAPAAPPADESVAIPATFWHLIEADEFHEIVMTGGLDAALCRRLWTHLGRSDAPPQRLELSIGAPPH